MIPKEELFETGEYCTPPKVIRSKEGLRIIGEGYLRRLKDRSDCRKAVQSMAPPLQRQYSSLKHGSIFHTVCPESQISPKKVFKKHTMEEDSCSEEVEEVEIVSNETSYLVHTLLDADKKVQVFAFIDNNLDHKCEEALVLRVLKKCARAAKD